MYDEQILILDLQRAKAGAPELDARLGQLVHPKKKIVMRRGEPYFEKRGKSKKYVPVPHYTRSIDASMPGEDIVRVELRGKAVQFWRAWRANEWSADHPTEAIARRLAFLTGESMARACDPNTQRKPARPIKRRSKAAPPSSTASTIEKPEPSWQDLTGNKDDLLELVGLLCDRLRVSTQPATVPDYAPFRFEGPSGDPPAFLVRRHKTHGFGRNRDVQDPGPMLSEVVVAWDTETRPRIQNRSRIALTFRRFIEFCGDRPINTYTRKDVLAFIEALRDMPKIPPREMLKLPMPVMLKKFENEPDAARLTDSTRSNYLVDLQTVFNWAYQREFCEIHPAEGLKIFDRRPQSVKRVPYDLADLKLIFEHSPLYEGAISPSLRYIPGDVVVRDSLFWFPLFALFSGARLSEMAYSTVDDYKREGDIDFLDIHAARDSVYLKTWNADRRLPIHPVLKDLGFLDFVAERRQKGMDLVFHEVQGRRNVTGTGWSQTWHIYQRRIGLTDKRKVLHSFRHNFKRACREAGIEEEVHDALTGHRHAFRQGRKYGGEMPLRIMADAMAKVEYSELDLSHLYS